MKRAIAIGVVTAAIVGRVSLSSAQVKPDPLSGLGAYIDKARQDWKIPGLAVSIVKNDSVVFAKGFGVRELGKPDLVDERTLFAIGSNTKSFTDTAAAMLVADGKLKWNDKASDLLPGFQLYDPYVTREITLRDLLSHRAGLGRRGDMLWYGTGYDRDEIIRRIRHLEPNAGFRTEMGYQNIMVLTAGQILGKVSGLGWDELIRKRIFEPLGMTTSFTSMREMPSRSNVATPHSIEAEKVSVIPHRNIDNIGPAGSIYSSVAEMANYLRFQIGRGTYNGNKLVSAMFLDQTWTPQINVGGSGDSLTHFTSYGMGWVLLDYRGRKIAWHNGGIDGFLSEMWVVPEEKLGVMVLTNGSPHALGQPLVMSIIDRFLGAPEKDRSAEALKQYQQQLTALEGERKRIESQRVMGTQPSLPLERYQGTYVDPMYGDFTVWLEGGRLLARYQGFQGPLEHWHFNTFRVSWGQSLAGGSVFVTFQIDAMAEVVKAEVQNVAVFRRPPKKA